MRIYGIFRSIYPYCATRSNEGDNSEYDAWNKVSRARKEALCNLVTTNTHGNSLIIYAKCKGLDRNRPYVCRETGEVFTGMELMFVGIPMPMVTGEHNAFQYHFDVKD